MDIKSMPRQMFIFIQVLHILISKKENSIMQISNLQTYTRLQKLNLSMSYRSMLRILDSLGTTHDAQVKCWKQSLVQNLTRNPQVRMMLPTITQVHYSTMTFESYTCHYAFVFTNAFPSQYRLCLGKSCLRLSTISSLWCE